MNKSIMIVEDEVHFHELYKEILEDTDYEIIHTYDGEEALMKLEEKRPDLIILDMILDMMTGDTFFLYLKGMPGYADIPIIIASSCHKNDYKNLRVMDPSLVYIDKASIGNELITKIKTRIG
jgi:CheY-like chemotaxis protein